MRRSVALGFFVLFGLVSMGFAQDASHGVSIRIPELLRLRLDDAWASRVEVPLRIEVVDGRYRIDPARTRIEVLANSGWQLSAAFRPAAGAGSVPLQFGVDGDWRDASSLPTVLAAGPATRGGHRVDVLYGLRSLPADGSYRGEVTYTLSRP